jgi:OOP family OmpA-OmpF porin
MHLSLSFLLASSALMLPGWIPAQNLVPNGSFEDYGVCPGSFSERAGDFNVTSWRAAGLGSPDYFNTCSEGEASVPYNWAGVSDAFDGYGYAGIYMWMNLRKQYREYLHCKLESPLIKDSLYRVEFRYKLSSYSKFSSDRIGLLLSDSVGRYAHDRPLDIPPTISFVKDSALTPETGSWELAVAQYKAHGGEQFLTIGNFDDNQQTRSYHIRFRPESQPMLAGSAYYYVDDVKVIPRFIDSEIRLPAIFTGEDTELYTTYILDNIQFEFNSYALLPVSYVDLDRVIAYLKDHKDVSVRLSGHTDSVGNAEYNKALSQKRAESAAAYLIANGIGPARISTLGYGESKPLEEGKTEKVFSINRRVEIEFHR